MVRIGELVRKISAYAQRAQTSALLHHKQYTGPDALVDAARIAAKYRAENLFNAPANRIADLLAAHPEVRGLAVDIGSGIGWCSAELATQFDTVVGIEPSPAAVNIATQLYPSAQYPNITWHVAFAREGLASVPYTVPSFFVTGVVLSHMRDADVEALCAELNCRAPVGSLLSFNEAWGDTWHQRMWHVRTPEWWRAVLPGWELDFHGPLITGSRAYRQGFHGVKRTT